MFILFSYKQPLALSQIPDMLKLIKDSLIVCDKNALHAKMLMPTPDEISKVDIITLITF